jgi:DNA modification methylase
MGKTGKMDSPVQQLEHWPLDRLIEYARNPRKNDHAVDKIAAAIKEFGFRVPIVAKSDGLVVDGHLRLKAAKKLKLATVPVLLADDLTETQIKAFRLSVNRMAEEARWDTDLLHLELADLAGDGFNIDLIGFSADELNALMADKTTGLTDPDDTPEVQAQEITRLGDTWLLGKHRLRCGDSTVATDVEALLAGVQPHLMVTDPPYGVEYDAQWRERAGVNTAGAAKGKVLNDDKADWREAWALFPGDVAYVWHAGLFAGVVADSLTATGFKLRSQIIWDKGQLVLSRGDYHWRHEPCWYAVKGKGHWAGDRKQTTLWQIDKPRKSETGHSTQKPVECMRRPIENNSSPGQAVYEPFSGSGTTIIAAEQTGRICYAMELSPAYVDVAVRRWQSFTGLPAKLEATGQPFSEVEHGAKAA